MGNDSKLGWKIKSQISRYASRLSQGLSKPKRRFVAEMLFGIQASKDVKVSQIARTLEESISLIKTENRLCRNLADQDLTDSVNRWLCWEGSGQVDEETVLAVDIGDIRKNYAEKMECLARVRDGSTGQIADGYWLCEVIAAHPYADKIVPLYGELYSQNARGFEGENKQILKAIGMVSAATGNEGIFTIDRGGDRRAILIPLIDKKLQFVVRQDGDRHVIVGNGRKCSVAEASGGCRCTVRKEVEIDREGSREVKHLQFGRRRVWLPEKPEIPLWLIVIRGFKKEPILLLTNVEKTGEEEHVVWIGDVYLTRWKCEEVYRFVKQSYNLEDVRVRSYVGLRNIYSLVHAISYFISVVIGLRSRLSLIFKKVCEKAKRFYEIGTFFHYAIADGIYRLLFVSKTGPKLPTPTSSPQLLLAFARPST